MPSGSVSPRAVADIAEILAWSRENFGPDDAGRYAALILAGTKAVAASPERIGSKLRPDLGDGIYTWHLRNSLPRPPGGGVRKPRHVLVYRWDEDKDVVTVVRVLHDSRDLPRHVEPGSPASTVLAVPAPRRYNRGGARDQEPEPAGPGTAQAGPAAPGSTGKARVPGRRTGAGTASPEASGRTGRAGARDGTRRSPGSGERTR